uniref:Putative ovule protein n=1 Tax=Solanum chacoense TaxID=4108 RepID=A0A0V0GNG8_SOLCH
MGSELNLLLLTNTQIYEVGRVTCNSYLIIWTSQNCCLLLPGQIGVESWPTRYVGLSFKWSDRDVNKDGGI